MLPWQNYKDDDLTAEERQQVRLTIERMDRAWRVLAPVDAALSSWKAWLAAVAFVVWLNRPDIVSALSTLIGGK
jgi:hypothetical protein